MTYDAASGLSVEWNDLNLIKKVSDGNGVLVNYTYLADGTKIRAVDADGEGLEYRGSLTFRRSSDDTLTPESIAFPGGRFVAMQGADGSIQMVSNYHIADHLGSVRTIVNGSTGQVVETNDYYAFGGRWDRSGSLIDQSNRYRYNSKEEQTTFGTPYSDYGARQYLSAPGRWLALDPLAEKYYGISPYAFCNNNPVNFVDPDGLSPIDTLEIEPAVIVETQVYKAQNEIIEYLPMITYASQADIAWKNRRYGSWAGNIIAGTADGLLFLIGTGKLTKTAKFLSSKSLKHIKK